MLNVYSFLPPTAWVFKKESSTLWEKQVKGFVSCLSSVAQIKFSRFADRCKIHCFFFPPRFAFREDINQEELKCSWCFHLKMHVFIFVVQLLVTQPHKIIKKLLNISLLEATKTILNFHDMNGHYQNKFWLKPLRAAMPFFQINGPTFHTTLRLFIATRNSHRTGNNSHTQKKPTTNDTSD